MQPEPLYLSVFSVIAKSAPSQQAIPEQASTPFRNMPAGDSGGNQQVFVI